MKCPNCEKDLEVTNAHVEIGDFTIEVLVYGCEDCHYAEAEIK